MDRPVRADARSNRERILVVAADVFGELGPGATTEEIARRARVGVGTVFRHFPTKEDLLRAVLVGRLDRLRGRALRLAEDHEAGEAFRTLFREMVADAAGKIAIAEALTEPGRDPAPEVQAAGAALHDAVGRLLRHAQEAGAIRSDIALPETYALLIGASRAAAHGQLSPATEDGMLKILFDGLAPVAHSPNRS